MTLTELSNIFNAITQNIAGLNSYHFGFLSDINTSIINNFNPSPKCSDPYPLVMFEPPAGSYRTHDSKIFRTVRLLFADRQDSDKNGAICETLLEKMSDLELLALSFMRSLYSIKTEGACLQSSLRKQEAAFNLDAYAFNDRLVTYELTFNLVTPFNTECIDIDLTSVNNTDNERVECFKDTFSYLYDGVDEYQEAPDNNTLSFGDGVTDTGLTFSMWIKPLNTGASQWLINKRGASVFVGLDEYQLVLFDTGETRLTLYSGIFNNNYLSALSTEQVNFGAWNHILYTYDGSKTFAGIKAYLNGAEMTLTDLSLGTYTGMNNYNRPLVIGKQGWANGGYYRGHLNEIGLFNIGFDAQEVAETYNGGKPTDLRQHSKQFNLAYWNRQGEKAQYIGGVWNVPDESKNDNTTISVNMEEVDRTTDTP